MRRINAKIQYQVNWYSLLLRTFNTSDSEGPSVIKIMSAKRMKIMRITKSGDMRLTVRMANGEKSVRKARTNARMACMALLSLNAFMKLRPAYTMTKMRRNGKITSNWRIKLISSGVAMGS